MPQALNKGKRNVIAWGLTCNRYRVAQEGFKLTSIIYGRLVNLWVKSCNMCNLLSNLPVFFSRALTYRTGRDSSVTPRGYSFHEIGAQFFLFIPKHRSNRKEMPLVNAWKRYLLTLHQALKRNKKNSRTWWSITYISCFLVPQVINADRSTGNWLVLDLSAYKPVKHKESPGIVPIDLF